MAYRIGTFLIDPEAYEMRHNGSLVPVEPQVFDLLVLLIANRHRPLSKDEIIERIWQGRAVSDATLSSRIRTARQALGDDGSAQRLIRTIHGRGFRFVGEVEEADLRAAPEARRQEVESRSSTLSDQLRALLQVPRRTVGAEARPDGVGVATTHDEGEARVTAPSKERRLAARLRRPRQWAVAIAAVIWVGLGGVYLLTRATGSSGSLPAASHSPLPTFRDCDACPEMVVLSEGFFLMGGAPTDQKRRNVELPQHLVRIARPVAIGRFEVTLDEFATFVDATGYQPATRCSVFVLDLDRWVWKGTTFRDPHYPQGGSHPVTCVSWLDAKAYTAWLSEKTGKPYRLPSEAEWEYAARAGTTTPFSFGDYIHARVCDYAKFADASTRFAWKDQSCNGNFGHGAAPVGRHRPNPWGLHDMHGNVWEWVEDCWHGSYIDASSDGTPWLEDNEGDCEDRITRGGSWRNAVQDLRVTNRLRYPVASAAQVRGFRVALSLDGR